MNHTKGRFSPLMDPLILDSRIANQRAGAFWDTLGSINWYNVIVNWTIPFLLFIFVAIHLRDKYDKKRDLYDEYIMF